MSRKKSNDKVDKNGENINDFDPNALSTRHKKRMNRIFRDYRINGFIPFPEVDSFFERLKSFVKYWLKRK